MDVVEYLIQVPWVKEEDSPFPTEVRIELLTGLNTLFIAFSRGF